MDVSDADGVDGEGKINIKLGPMYMAYIFQIRFQV